MQNINDFKPSLGTAILLVGGAGVGKTTLGLRLFKGTYVFVSDLNFSSGLDYLKKLGGLENVAGFDTASPDENGKIVPVNMQYQRMLDKLTAAMQDSKVNAILLDSASFMEDVLKAKICNASNPASIKLTGYDQWGTLMLAWKSILLQIRQSGKTLIMTAHEQKEQDESDSIYKYQIAVDGGIRGRLPALFSDVWRCEIAETMGNHTWNVRTLGNVRQEHLKRSSRFSSLPPVAKQDDVVKLIWSQHSSSPSIPAMTQTSTPLPKT
jgi:GTPase SAR1 family protein